MVSLMPWNKVGSGQGMIDQILWINALAAISVGLLLVVTPKSTLKLCGLPQAAQSLYPRLLGVNLLSVAVAIVLEGNGREGLGIQGMSAINLVAGSALVLLLLFGGLIMAKRGRWLLRAIAAGHLVLGGLGLLAG